VSVLVALLVLQGAIGFAQYALRLPAEIVWVHVVNASLAWLALLWCVAEAGRPAPRAVAAGQADRLPLETVRS
jgi:cytochrome c oxidase assembly protein subunit 15